MRFRLPWRGGKTPEPLEDKVGSILQEHRILSNLSRRELQKIRPFMTVSDLEEGEKLFQQGDLCPGLVLLISGEIRLFHHNQSNQPVSWSVTSPGQVIGELGLIDSEPSLVTAEASSRSRVVVFHHDQISELIDRYPKLGSKFLLNLSRFIGFRLRQINERLGTAVEP